VRDQATCPNETPSSATFMNRKLAPHVTPIARNCSHAEAAPGRLTDAAGGAAAVVVRSLTDRGYVRPRCRRHRSGGACPESAEERQPRATDAAAFFRKYYVPSNIVVTVVGDVKASTALPILERYFGRLPKAPAPEPLRTIEPPQRSERTITIQETAQPIYLEGYHRPASSDPDNAVYDVISDLMAKGRTSRLYKSLVRDQKIASQAGGFNGFPGEKYPNLFMFYGFTTPGHTGREIGDAIHKEIDRLKSEDVSADELASVKTRAKADLLRQLDSNSGLALQIAITQTILGDWRELFRSVDRIDKVTAADVRRVANVAFVPTNRTVGLIESTSQKPAAKGESK